MALVCYNTMTMTIYKKFVHIFIRFIAFPLSIFLFVGISSAFAYSNLLTNPGAESGSMTGWTIDNNGGNGWGTDWNGPGHSDNNVFSTSHGWDTRHQTIDLVAAGYTAEQLDSGTFDAKMSEWIYTRGDQGGRYYINFELRAADGVTVLASYNHGTMGSPITLAAGVPWFQETHTFTNIPSGTRFIYFEDGGRDISGWAGRYGTNFDDASVVLADTTLYELTYGAGLHGTLTGTTTQTLSSGSNGTAITAVPVAGYTFVDWSDASTANPRTDTNVTQNISVTANYVIQTRSITYAAGTGGSITGTTSQTVNYGSDGTAVTAVAASGYVFASWSDASTTNPRTDTNVTSNISITANFTDIANPVISNTSSAPLVDTGSIRWTTDENASSIVEYGTTSNYGITTPEFDTSPRLTNHNVYLSNLTPCATYHFRVKSTDATANQAMSGDNTFQTSGCGAVPVSFLQQLSQASVPVVVPIAPETAIVTTGIPIGFQFSKDLRPLLTDGDVRALQQFLNANGFIVSLSGPGSKGNETDYFGLKTKLALAQFQEAHKDDILKPLGLARATGTLGPYSRKVINAWMVH